MDGVVVRLLASLPLCGDPVRDLDGLVRICDLPCHHRAPAVSEPEDHGSYDIPVRIPEAHFLTVPGWFPRGYVTTGSTS